MNYFKEAICFDPVNYYLMLKKEDLLHLKSKIDKDEIEILKKKLEGIHISYPKEKRSVIYKKEILEGVDKKDYVSLATYYWPNPDTPSHLPYIARDGEANPEGFDYDKDKLRELAYISYYQGLLYYLTEDKRYYEELKENIIYFFLDEETGMNPNLEHAQLIRGVNLGRGIGIIDFTANFSYTLRLLKILNELEFIEEEFYYSLGSWLSKLAHWMCYSKIGLEEKYAKNNHGIFYDLGLAVIFDYLGNSLEMAPLVSQMIEYRLVAQIEADGSMPAENQRTKSKNYSLMAIKGIYDFNTIVKEYGFDLYEVNNWYCRKVQFDIKKAIEFILERLVLKKKDWNFKQIIPFDEGTLLPLLYECKKMSLLKEFPDIDKLNMKFDILRVFLKM